MKHFFHRLETTENALRLSTILLVLPMFFITDARILCTTDTGAYLQTISNIETQGLAAAIPMTVLCSLDYSCGLANHTSA
jgi:hypothetical protein